MSESYMNEVGSFFGAPEAGTQVLAAVAAQGDEPGVLAGGGIGDGCEPDDDESCDPIGLPPIDVGPGDGDGGGGGDDECDPMYDPNFCLCDDDDEGGGGINSVPDGGAGLNGVPPIEGNCDGWEDPPGDGGGGGGGGILPPDPDPEEEWCRPYLNPECVHRYIDDRSQAELAALGATIARLIENECYDMAAILDTKQQDGMMGLWDFRHTYAGFPRYGRYVSNEPGEVYYQFILVWSGEAGLSR